MARTTARCNQCGTLHNVANMVRTTSAKRGERGAYICMRCASHNLNYHATNSAIVGTEKANRVFVGIEYESSYSDEYARNAFAEYKFIPTHDGSLESDGNGCRYGTWDRNSCEYVSGLMRGLNQASKFALTCDRLMQDGHLKVNGSCGTHFHVSVDSMKDAHGNKTYMGYIRRFYHSLFDALNNAVASDPEKAVAVFGRYFNHYAKQIASTSVSDNDRYLWVNVTNDTNIEFRLNRFVSGKQYQNLMKMEVEMTKAIVTNFCEHFMDTEWDTNRYPTRTEYRKHKAEVTANKLVKLYEKFSANI